jgi:uncharacterized membrane protein
MSRLYISCFQHCTIDRPHPYPHSSSWSMFHVSPHLVSRFVHITHFTSLCNITCQFMWLTYITLHTSGAMASARTSSHPSSSLSYIVRSLYRGFVWVSRLSIIIVGLVLVQSSVVFCDLPCSATWFHILIMLLCFVYCNLQPSLSYHTTYCALPHRNIYQPCPYPLLHIASLCNAIIVFRTLCTLQTCCTPFHVHHITSHHIVRPCISSYHIVYHFAHYWCNIEC